MGLVGRTKLGLIRRLARAVARERAGQMGPPPATVGLGAVIHPEAVIDNLSGLADRIEVGPHSHVRGRLVVYAQAGRVRLGSYCYVGARTEIWAMDSITIGDRVLISHGVNIMDNTGHSKDAGERHAHFRRIVGTGHPARPDELPGIRAAPVVIEDDVWINFNVTVLRGVRIGARSVIAAGSIVTKDVPADTMYHNEVRGVLRPLTP